ncbi:DUF969 domain-containing protein [Erysipelothrix inopinata]|uniref:DUF969 domain-containing protein n=1 Tax=Erysipelothrix inopinata TaxID=225084 RepID=A0A7G9RZ88_9FIRM|nr:DUF969 domain-containing protein [Erysipelothrix inopinata]QNN60913.1 DUF969 domain-containing protein [Erysipelothrix inopinata]
MVDSVNLWLLTGIVIIVVGFALKLDSLAVVLVAAIVTALIGGMSFMEVVGVLGEKFVSQRGLTIFVLTLPVVGLCERYGLREQAVKLIQKMKVLTAGRVIFVYQLIRQFAAAGSLRLGGHPQFVRPLIQPMAEGAAVQSRGEDDLTDDEKDEIKAAAAASDNYGNFFGQNLFLYSSGTNLIVETLVAAGFAVTNRGIAMWSIPIFVCSLVFGGVQTVLLDRRLAKGGKK